MPYFPMIHQKHFCVQNVGQSVAKLVNEVFFESGMFLTR